VRRSKHCLSFSLKKRLPPPSFPLSSLHNHKLLLFFRPDLSFRARNELHCCHFTVIRVEVRLPPFLFSSSGETMRSYSSVEGDRALTHSEDQGGLFPQYGERASSFSFQQICRLFFLGFFFHYCRVEVRSPRARGRRPPHAIYFPLRQSEPAQVSSLL